MRKIEKIEALKILDSRGDWTLEAMMTLEGGAHGSASVPSGKSVSSFEAKTLPAETAVSLIEGIIRGKLTDQSFVNLEDFDRNLILLDGTPDKSKIGGNTILALSCAFAKASAAALNLTLYDYIDSIFYPKVRNFSMPVPLFNLINGGRHASDGLDFQEFLVIPASENIDKNIEMGQKIYQALGSILLSQNFSTDVGDEGGFAPRGLRTQSALNFLQEAGKMVGFTAGKDFFLGLDCAASQLFMGDAYKLKNEGVVYTAAQFRDYYLRLTQEFPIVYLEDPLSENSFEDWQILKKEMKGQVDVVGDDLIATNSVRVDMAVANQAVSAVIIKPNQVGTISETLAAVKNCRQNHLAVVASHRSGDTSDPFIADFAVGVGAKYLKAGAPARGERVAKYDRLLEIEKEITKS